ncbi:MAG: TonB-dependent receptor [Sphingomonas bacterium]
MLDYRKCASLFALAAGLTLAVQAQAQEQAASADQAVEETAAATGDIVVTATRNSTLASKTPVALTAVSGSTLTAQGVTNPTNLGDQVPNLAIDRNNGLQITIRGISSADNTEKGDPSAAFMSDGIYIARTQAQEVSFYDIARVEVLRGPQGTLFGRNTTAGLVNIITNAPELGRFGGSFDAAYGNYNNTQITGVLNVPVGEHVALRGAVNYDRRDNFTRSNGRWTSELDPYKNNISGRLSALFDFGPAQLTLRGDYSSMRGQANPNVPTANFYKNFGTNGVDPIYIGNDKTADELNTVGGAYGGSLARRNNTWGIMADFKYDLGPVTLNYLGSYRKFNRDENSVGTLYGGVVMSPTHYDGHYWQNSQELRLSTSGSGPIKAQAGIYYFKEQSSIVYDVYGLLSQTPNTPGYVYSFVQDPTISESWAGFGQVTWSITDRLRLTGGVRYSHDRKSRIGINEICSTLACNLPTDRFSHNDADRTFSKTTWRAGVDYDLNDRSLLYAVVSTGYKAGGFNDGCLISSGILGCVRTPDQLYYRPETLTSYEAGLKTRFLDNAVRLNLSVFHYDYTDMQLTQILSVPGSAPVTLTTNAAKAKVDGVEAEGVVTPSHSDRFDFSFSWLNARYASFVPAPGYDWTGRKLDRSPNLGFTAGYTHTFDLANGGNVQLGARTRVSDGYELAALGTLNQFRVPSYSKTDLLLSYNAPSDRWYIQGYVKNIENSLVVTAAATGYSALITVADPRTYGVRAGFKF